MKRLILIIVLSILAVSGFAQGKSRMLEMAYEKRSADLLDKFFADWHRNTVPANPQELSALNDTVREAYKVFTAFYQPEEICRLANYKGRDHVYSGVRYLILPTYITLQFADTIDKEGIGDENIEIFDDVEGIDYRYEKKIGDFRPAINCGNRQPLYLTPEYDSLLSHFLGSVVAPFSDRPKLPIRSPRQVQKRERFISDYIRVCRGHWGGSWDLYSFPRVYRIRFDKEMSKARVYCKIEYTDAEAVMEKKNGQWGITSVVLGGVE